MGEDPCAVSIVCDPGDSISDQAQLNHRLGHPSIDAALEREDSRFAIHSTRCKPPRRRPALIVSEVGRPGDWTGETIGYEHTRVRSNQGADAVPVAAIESLDVIPNDRVWYPVPGGGCRQSIGCD